MSNYAELLDQNFDEGTKVRPMDLFSLDHTFYEGLENCKFYLARITRTGSHSGTYGCFALIEDPCDERILN